MKLAHKVWLWVIATAFVICMVALFLPEPPMVGPYLLEPPKAHAASQFANIVCDNFKPISSAASLQIITAGNANMFLYICAEQFGSIGGSTFSIVEGTGATCGTGTAAMVGGTTAAAGIGLAANGVITTGSGTGAITRTAVAGDNVCIIMAGAGPLAGSVAWTTAPF